MFRSMKPGWPVPELSVARQFCRNKNTTNITSANAVPECYDHFIDRSTLTTDTVSNGDKEVNIFRKCSFSILPMQSFTPS